MLKLKPVREYTSVILCCTLTVIGMQICAMTDDTLWHCDLTAEMNVTENSEHKAKVSVKVRTSLERKCWIVQQVGNSSSGEVLFTKPVTKCQLQQVWYRLRERRKTTDNAITTIELTKSGTVVSLYTSSRQCSSQHTTSEKRCYDLVSTSI